VALAREIGIPEVLVPARPGLTNALGCLVADLRQDQVNTLNRGLEEVPEAEIAAILAAQRDRAMQAIAAGGAEVEETLVLHQAEMQFRGQTHLLRVALPSAAPTRAAIQAAFEDAYFRRFRIRLPEIRAVLVNLATSVIGRRTRFPLARLLPVPQGAARLGTRRIFADGDWHEAALWRREALAPGDAVEGPAVVVQQDATTVLEPGSRALVDPIGNLRIRV
jgi:N-methylhydantoinase A